MPDLADKAAADFAAAWKRVQRQVGNMYSELRALPAEQLLAELAEMDLSAMIGDMLQGDIKKLNTAYMQQLNAIQQYAAVDGQALEALALMESRVVTGKVIQAGAEIQRLLAQSIVGGVSEADFAASLLNTGLRVDQANALANDSLRKYDRSVRKLMAKEAPPDKLYINTGPVDSVTEDICLSALEAGPMTLEEWEAHFPGYFDNGGHFNCRHRVVPYHRTSQYKDKDIERETAARNS